MEQNKKTPREAVCAALAGHRLPAWGELPDLELYMDQVLSLMGRYLGDYPGFDRKGLTASMVNNYVKMGVAPPPVKKRYGRVHLARLLMICVLKASLPIAAVRELLERVRGRLTEAEMYESFRALLQETSAAAAAACAAAGEDSDERAACRAALRAQAEQALARALAAPGGE